jgi:hypothetical protein
VGCLSVCLCGTGALVSVPCGVAAWLMANYDLERMRQGRMDPRGKDQTESGRTAGIVGAVVGLIFAAIFAFLGLVR